uniref:Uncharacterized protein n=1 Tax=Gadus morhua TaxID=8049 RepID=A0A8C5CFZ7_GADMO
RAHLWTRYLYCFFFLMRALTCLSLKERLLLVRTFSLWRIIMKFLFLFFSLLLVLANGFSLLCFFAKSFLSDRPACWEKKINTQ